MLTVIYSMTASLDGYIADPAGNFDWTAPDAELFRFHIEQVRELTGYLLGRRLYEEMLVWETAEQTLTDPSQLEFARIWKALPKVVFSRTLTKVEGNARLARKDVADEIAELKNQPGDGIVSVGGATFAASVAERDLTDEYRLFVKPVLIGGGIPYFPPLPKRLELIETRTFSNTLFLRYRRS